MNIELKQVTVTEKEILRNLLEKYEYEFSQWNKLDVNSLGLYGYNYLDCYWTEEKRYAYFIMVEGKIAGFAMINDYPEVDEPTDYCLSEFFIMLKYRNKGIGKIAAYKVFDLFHGKWQLKMHPHNKASVCFWNNIISEYTNNKYSLIKSYPNTEYEDGTLGDVILFQN